MTLRTWIKAGYISAFKLHRMYVMSMAEQEALSVVVRKYHQRTKHAEVSPAFIEEARKCLAEVRKALDALSKGHILTDRQQQLLLPSIQETQ
jgi:hypothetical protein